MSIFGPFPDTRDAGDSNTDKLVERLVNFNAEDPGESKSVSPIVGSADQKYQRTPAPATSFTTETKDSEVVHRVDRVSITDAIQKCTQLFCRVLLHQSKDRGLSKSSLTTSTHTDKFFSEIAESFDRFKIWTANMGAYLNGYSALDYRLRDASNVSEQVISLLSELDESLMDVFKVTGRDKQSWAQENEKDRVFGPGEKRLFNFKSKIENLLADIRNILGCLYRLSTVIEDPAPHDQIIFTPTAYDTNDKSQYIELVMSKHANISENLAERLVNSITQRRAYFNYRKARYENGQMTSVTRMSQPYTHIKTTSEISLTPRPALESLGSSEPSRSRSKGTEEATNTNLPQIQELHDACDLAPAVTDTPPGLERLFLSARPRPSISKAALFLANRMKEESEREYKSSRTIPKSANSEDGSSAAIGPENWLVSDLEQSSSSRCPLCWTDFYIIEVADWKKHILSDLRPYICVEADCREPEQLYGNHQEWIRHVRHSHWMEWACTAGCAMSFTEETDLTYHLQSQHAGLAEGHLDSLIDLSARPGSGFHEMDCPFCLEKMTTEIQYQQHIGQHQELLASLILSPEENIGPATASTGFATTSQRPQQDSQSNDPHIEESAPESSSQPYSRTSEPGENNNAAEGERRSGMVELIAQFSDFISQGRESKALKSDALEIEKEKEKEEVLRNAIEDYHNQRDRLRQQEDRLLRQKHHMSNQERVIKKLEAHASSLEMRSDRLRDKNTRLRQEIDQLRLTNTELRTYLDELSTLAVSPSDDQKRG